MSIEQSAAVSNYNGHGSDKEIKGNTAQFLTFAVEGAEYGVDIMKVREIKGWEETTRIPNSPEYMRGVINLRGVVIPIFDLRTRFSMGRTEATEKHVVIIIAIGSKTIGILVDAVSDILTVGSDEIKPAPSTSEIDIDEAYLEGLISIDKKMVVLLDVEHLFSAETLAEAEKAAAKNKKGDKQN